VAGDNRASKRLAAVLPPGAAPEVFVRGQARIGGKKKATGVALCRSAVAVVALGAWNARPKELLALVPVEVLGAADATDERTLTVSGTDIRLKKRDRRRLLDAAAGRHTDTVPSASPGWYPVESGPATQGYWDGSTWVAVGRWQDGAWVDLRLPVAVPSAS